MTRPQRNRLVKTLDRSPMPLQFLQGDPPVVVCGGTARVPGDGLVHHLEGEGKFFLLGKYDAQHVQRIKIIRLGLEDLLIKQPGLPQAAGLMQGQGLLQDCFLHTTIFLPARGCVSSAPSARLPPAVGRRGCSRRVRRFAVVRRPPVSVGASLCRVRTASASMYGLLVVK